MTVDPGLASSPPVQSATTAVLTTAATNAVLAVVALATGVLAARLLGPSGRGHLAAAQAVGTLIGAVGSLSLGEAVVFFVGRKCRSAMVVLQTATLVAAASTTALVGAAVLMMPKILAGQPAAVGAARAYVLIGLPFILLGFPITFMRALQQYRIWNVLRLISPLCWLGSLLVFTVTQDREVQPLILVFVLLQILFVPMVWVLASRSRSGSGGIDLGLVMPMLRYGTPLFLASLPLTLNLRVDQILIANVESADQLGLYAVSVSWAAIGLPLMAAIGAVLFPKLAAMERADAIAVLVRSSRVGVVIAVLIGLLSAISAPALVPFLFGRSFSVPLALPLVLAAATSILGLNGILEEGMRGLGEPRSVLVAELAGLVATITLLLTLVPGFGITGAAAASLGGYAVINTFLVWRTVTSMNVPVSALLVPQRSDIENILEQARALTRRRAQRNQT